MMRTCASAYRAATVTAAMFCMFAAGCASSDPSGSASSEVTPGSNAVATTDSDTTPGSGSAIAFGPGSFDMPDPATALDALAGYTATTTITFDGTRDGQPFQFSQTSVLHRNAGLRARFLTVQAPDASAPAVFSARLGDGLYTLGPDGACAAATAEATDDSGTSDEEIPEPALLLSGVMGADPAGNDVVDGVPVDHYTFDERAMGSLDPATITGELWVATTGGHLMRSTMVSEGTLFALGAGVEGTLTVDYALTDIDAPFAAALPADCPPMVDAPLLPDATDIDAHPGFLGYTTATSPQAALEFYQQALPPLGWAPGAGMAIVAEGGGRINFVASGSKLAIIVTTSASGTQVIVLQQSTAP